MSSTLCMCHLVQDRHTGNLSGRHQFPIFPLYQDTGHTWCIWTLGCRMKETIATTASLCMNCGQFFLWCHFSWIMKGVFRFLPSRFLKKAVKYSWEHHLSWVLNNTLQREVSYFVENPHIPSDCSVVAFPAVWFWSFYFSWMELLGLEYGVTQFCPCEVAVYKTMLSCSENLHIWSTSEVYTNFAY